MSTVLKSFLVGIGMQYDDRGGKAAIAGIEGIGKKALQVGAMIAGAFGFKALTKDFADFNDKLGKFSQVFGVNLSDIAALGRAFESEGGNFDTMLSNVENLQRIRAGLLTGDFSIVPKLELAGVTDQEVELILKAKDATESLLIISSIMERLTGKQRLNAASALGFDEESIVFLSKGRKEIEALLADQKKMRDVNEQMVRDSKELKKNWNDVNTNVGGVADEVSKVLIPALNEGTDAINAWFERNRGVLKKGAALATGIVVGSTRGFLEYHPVLNPVENITRGYLFMRELRKDINETTPPPEGELDAIFNPSFDPAQQILQIERERSEQVIKVEQTNPQQPIKVETNVILDGEVIDRRIEEHNNKVFDTAIESSTGGR